MIKFNLFSVTDGARKAKVWYSLDNRTDGKKCVTICAREYGAQLRKIFPSDTENLTDLQTDYFDKDRVRLFESHPLYQAARTTANRLELKRSKGPKATAWN